MDDLTKRAQEALAGTTDGPWQVGELDHGSVVNWHFPPDHPCAFICSGAGYPDAQFIAEARQLVPAMLARIEADAARIRELEALVRALVQAAADCNPAQGDDIRRDPAVLEARALLARMGGRDA